METMLRGVFLTSGDPERTAGFYRDVGGLPLEAVTGGGYTYWRLESDSMQVAIHNAEGFADYADPPNPDSNLTHLYFTIEDREAFLTHLEAQGVDPLLADEVVVTVVDPDGRKVMFGTA